MTNDKKLYELYLATVKGTGWPIDGHRLVFAKWNYSPNSYGLFDWDEKNKEVDDAVMMTMLQTEVEAGFEDADGLEAFKETWKAGQYDPPGAFHLDPDQVENVVKIDKSPYV